MLLLENADHDPRHHLLNVLLVPGEDLLDFSPKWQPQQRPATAPAVSA
jgi:hypothetical protein